jgi:hypothetical protein
VKIFRFQVCGAVFLALLALVGCAPSHKQAVTTKLPPEKIAMQRAQERWDALLVGNMEKAYGFISPAGRLLMSPEEYRRRVNSEFWRGVKVKSAECEAELCSVKLDLDYRLANMNLSQVISEKWILENDSWWYVYQP